MGNRTNNKRIQMSEEIKDYLKNIENIPDPVKIHGKKYYPKKNVGCGYKGVVWRGKDESEADVAIKFTIAEDYQDKSFLQELHLAGKLRGREEFAQYIDADVIEISIHGKKRKFVCFIEEWIDGPTLEQYLQNKDQVTGTFLREFVNMMCSALSQFRYLGLCHDDLRATNIKIAPPKPGSIEKYETKLKIIDMGSLKHAPSRKKIDDHKWFVKHIVDICNAIHSKKYLSVAEKRFIRNIEPLIERMLENDLSVALVDPLKIKKQFEGAWTKSASGEENGEKLDDPFYYIYAESMSDKLVTVLFAEKCPWKKEIIGPDPLLLTGPRGCGKSTIFRRMSLKGLLYKDRTEIEKTNIVGFYIPCVTDFKNRVNWIISENLARRYKRYVIHYFNLLLTKSIVETLYQISLREDRESLFGFGDAVERQVYDFVINKLKIEEENRRYLHGYSPIARLLEIVRSEMENCYEALLTNKNLSFPTSVAYISDLSEFLCNIIPYFKNRKIVFFIDDLSTRIIGEPVQQVLNDIILLGRGKNHVFKISSDKNGWVGIDALSKNGEWLREYREVDLGRYYISEVSLKDKVSFTIELLEKRMAPVGYKGTPKELIGESKYKEGSLIKEIRKRVIDGKRIDDVYHGIQTISELCAGDIAVLLEIFREIFYRGKVERNIKELVPPRIQHEAILSVSRKMYNQIKNFFPYGNEMYTIVTSFGKLMRNILHKGKPHKAGERYVVPSAPRIELDEDPSQSYIEMGEKPQRVMEELIKRAVFIELEPSGARRTLKPSLRWHIRPILCPTFEVAPQKTVAIKWSPEEFKYFLTAPEDKCSQEFNSKWKLGEKELKASEEKIFVKSLDMWTDTGGE